MSKLKIVSVENTAISLPTFFSSKTFDRLERIRATQMRMERFWLQHPKVWDPIQSASESERIQRTFQLIQKHMTIKDLTILDIGCGEGSFSRLLCNNGAHLLAVDTSENALKIFKKKNEPNHLSIATHVETLPLTTLSNSVFDLVVCMDVIAELDQRDFRLGMSELSRLVKSTGWVVCSTKVDCYAEDALQRFLELFQTEFMLSEAVYSYHRYFPWIKNRNLMLWLEKFNQKFWQRSGITHAILLGKKKLI